MVGERGLGAVAAYYHGQVSHTGVRLGNIRGVGRRVGRGGRASSPMDLEKGFNSQMLGLVS